MNNTNTPTVALIGLPNSGKSTLINRLCGKRTAITANEAHTTRDLNYGYCDWENWFMKIIDTGGLVPNPEDEIQRMVQVKSWSGISQADLLVWVIDRRQNPDTISQEIIQRLWKTGKPFIIAINKIDTVELEKPITDYAKLGPEDFVNVSAMNGLGLDELLEAVVAKLEKMGFSENYDAAEELRTTIQDQNQREHEEKGRQHKNVNYSSDGNVIITRQNNSDGPGLFESHSTEDTRKVKIKNILFDIDEVLMNNGQFWPRFKEHIGVSEKVFDQFKNVKYKTRKLEGEIDFPNWIRQWLEKNEVKYDPELVAQMLIDSNIIDEDKKDLILQAAEYDYKLFISTDRNNWTADAFVMQNEIEDSFESIYSSSRLGTTKTDPKYFEKILKEQDIEAGETLFIDDRIENIETAKALGIWTIHYIHGETDLNREIEKIELGFDQYEQMTPKVMMLGKPNVGKSSITNILLGKEEQIVTDIAGTTLSVNDYEVEYADKSYTLLDSTGIRKAGKRNFGVETFATYETIEQAHKADVIMFVVDANQAISSQDQLIAGIIKETNAGVVVLANKADLIEEEDRKKFIKDFGHKFRFLKIEKFIFTSATEMQRDPSKVRHIWGAVDTALDEHHKYIPKEEVRKLFNYLIKQKPPNKLRHKKRPVIYDLVYTNASPPTFELMVKDKTRLHWSYTRFVENMIRKNFGFANTGVKLKIVEIEQKNVVG